MIGIICREQEKEISREFFQLFKTPNEFYQNNGNYTVVVSTTGEIVENNAKVQIIFNSERTPIDKDIEIHLISVKKQPDINYIKFYDIIYPIYCRLSLCSSNMPLQMHIHSIKTVHDSPAVGNIRNTTLKYMSTIGCIKEHKGKKIVRIGYDLFSEISFILKKGQPPCNSFFPTLDIHIAVLRYLIVSSGILIVECPPVPKGYKFMAAITHDVDFVKIKNHFVNNTLLGFIYRAGFVSLINFFKKKKTIKEVFLNWKSIFLLPFIHFGLYPDIWNNFEKYSSMENEYSSTFFIIPYKNNPGKSVPDKNMGKRATKYDVTEIKSDIQSMIKKGFEIGVHSIDAWYNSEKGKNEIQRITSITGTNQKIGNRLHWLFFNEQSYKHLEDAGFFYDSTIGYNETVGFRTGTLQAYCPLGVSKLRELPLHIQDTALFFPGRMNLSPKKAHSLCNNLISLAGQLGGVLTINWHMRSIAPERLWGDFYKALLKKLHLNKTWISNACSIVDWFNKRRALDFTKVIIKDKTIYIDLDYKVSQSEPELELRIYKPYSFKTDSIFQGDYNIIPLKKHIEIQQY